MLGVTIERLIRKEMIVNASQAKAKVRVNQRTKKNLMELLRSRT